MAALFEDIHIVDIIDGPYVIILLHYLHVFQKSADDAAYVLGDWFVPLLNQWCFINPTPRRLFLIHLALHDAADD